MACDRIKAAITEGIKGDRPIKAILDPYNPTGSSIHVNFNTSKPTLWQTDPRLCHLNWVVCDSDWEAEFCRVVEAHPHVKAYVKNQGLGLEVPYQHGSTPGMNKLGGFGRWDFKEFTAVYEIEAKFKELLAGLLSTPTRHS